MAAANPFHGEPASLERAVAFQGLYCIGGTTGREPAFSERSEKKGRRWRDHIAIKPYAKNQRILGHVHPHSFTSTISLSAVLSKNPARHRQTLCPRWRDAPPAPTPAAAPTRAGEAGTPLAAAAAPGCAPQHCRPSWR